MWVFVVGGVLDVCWCGFVLGFGWFGVVEGVVLFVVEYV